MPSAQTRPSVTSSPPSQKATAKDSSKTVTLVEPPPMPLPEALALFCDVVTAWNCVHQMTLPPSRMRPHSLRMGVPSSACVMAISVSCGLLPRRAVSALARRLSTTAPPTAPSAPPTSPPSGPPRAVPSAAPAERRTRVAMADPEAERRDDGPGQGLGRCVKLWCRPCSPRCGTRDRVRPTRGRRRAACASRIRRTPASPIAIWS